MAVALEPPLRARAPRRAARDDRGPFHASISFGRVAGVEIGAHWSWLIVVSLVIVSLASSVFPDAAPGLSDLEYGVMAVAATLLFFASLLLHELGHALTAKREGMQIEGITLWVFGGVARFAGMFPSAGAELRIALAGPLVSVLIGAGSLGAVAVLPLPDAVHEVVSWLGQVNLVLVAFNMLPALPLDGGRVLRALLWLRSGDFVRATRVAASLGNGFGLLLVFGGLLLLLAGAPGGLWFALIGWFLTIAAGAEAQMATMRGALAGLEVRDAMSQEAVTVEAGSALSDFFDDFRRTRHSAYPVVAEGRVVGLLPYSRAAGVPVRLWPATSARARMLPLEDTLVVRAEEPLADVATELIGGAAPAALVTSGGELAGIVTRTDVARTLDLQRLVRST